MTKRIVQMTRLFSIVFLLCQPILGFSQHFTHRAPIEEIPFSAWYRIELTPAIRDLAASDLHDLRVLDNSGKEKPFIIEKGIESNSVTRFEAYSYSIHQSDKGTECIIQMPGKSQSTLFMQFANARSVREIEITGSNDKSEWYMVSLGRIELNGGEGKGTQWIPVNFPSVTYRYIRVLIKDSAQAPLHILQAGVFRQQGFPGRLDPVSGFTYRIAQDKEKNITKITGYLEQASEINKLTLVVNGPRYFNRSMRVLVINRQTDRKGNARVSLSEVDEFLVISGKQTQWTVNRVLEDSFILEIDNRDNPPLEISDIQLFRYPVSLIGYFEKGEKLWLYQGDRELAYPEYDLASFIKDTAEGLRELKAGKPQLLEEPRSEVKVANLPFYETKEFLWLCITSGGIISLLFAVKMIREKNGSESQNS